MDTTQIKVAPLNFAAINEILSLGADTMNSLACPKCGSTQLLAQAVEDEDGNALGTIWLCGESQVKFEWWPGTTQYGWIERPVKSVKHPEGPAHYTLDELLAARRHRAERVA